MLGASGAVSAAIGIAVVRMPRVQVTLPMGVLGVHVPLIVFGALELTTQLLGALVGGAHVAFVAHLVGLAIGALVGVTAPRRAAAT